MFQTKNFDHDNKSFNQIKNKIVNFYKKSFFWNKHAIQPIIDTRAQLAPLN